MMYGRFNEQDCGCYNEGYVEERIISVMHLCPEHGDHLWGALEEDREDCE